MEIKEIIELIVIPIFVFMVASLILRGFRKIRELQERTYEGIIKSIHSSRDILLKEIKRNQEALIKIKKHTVPVEKITLEDLESKVNITHSMPTDEKILVKNLVKDK